MSSVNDNISRAKTGTGVEWTTPGPEMFSSAIRTQLSASKVTFAVPLWHQGGYKRFFAWGGGTYHAITAHQQGKINTLMGAFSFPWAVLLRIRCRPMRAEHLCRSGPMRVVQSSQGSAESENSHCATQGVRNLGSNYSPETLFTHLAYKLAN